jgi:hypothetical protein
MRDGSRAGLYRADRIHVPHAPGDRARPSGVVSHLRHGARAANGVAHRRGEPGADRHDAAVLDRRAARAPCVPAGDGRHGAGHGSWRPHRSARCQLGRVGVLHARGALGRLAVLPTCVGVDRQSPREHVHADRAWRRRGVPLQCCRHGSARDVPRGLPGAWCGRALFRHRGRDHRARAARSGPRAACTRAHERRHPAAAGTRTKDSACDSQRRGSRRPDCDGQGWRRDSRQARREGAGRWARPRRADVDR